MNTKKIIIVDGRKKRRKNINIYSSLCILFFLSPKWYIMISIENIETVRHAHVPS